MITDQILADIYSRLICGDVSFVKYEDQKSNILLISFREYNVSFVRNSSALKASIQINQEIVNLNADSPDWNMHMAFLYYHNKYLVIRQKKALQDTYLNMFLHYLYEKKPQIANKVFEHCVCEMIKHNRVMDLMNFLGVQASVCDKKNLKPELASPRLIGMTRMVNAAADLYAGFMIEHNQYTYASCSPGNKTIH